LEGQVRLVLSTSRWRLIEKLCVGKPGDLGGTGANNRIFVEAFLWIARTGSPWRDLPAQFGKWNSIFVRFNRGSKTGVWQRIFAALSDDPDFEYLIIDSTIVRAHQHAAGAKGDSKSRPRPLARGPDEQDPPGGARSGPAGALPADRRPTQ
jgi:putative transposase